MSLTPPIARPLTVRPRAARARTTGPAPFAPGRLLGALVAGVACVATAAAVDPVAEDFEAEAPGSLPAAPWADVVDLTVDPTLVTPTAVVIETTGALGQPTLAVQTVDHIGSSQGIYRPVEIGAAPKLTARLRIDQYGDANTLGRWPIAAGFSANVSSDDLNVDPHAVVYAYPDGRWYLYIKPNGGTTPPINAIIATPTIVLGQWYEIRLDAQLDLGRFTATVRDAQSGAQLGTRTINVPGWDASLNPYDAITFFDGEYNAVSGTVGGQATIDDVVFETTLPCTLDLDLSGDIGLGDLLSILASWGPCGGGGCQADLNGDGSVGFSDVVTLLASWGPCPA